MDKQLKSKAIKIKGKDYVQVADRIIYFNDTYENGCIKTNLLSSPDSQVIVVQAVVVPDAQNPDREFTGLAQEKMGDGMINKTSAMENAETSAVGRALAMLGIGVIDSVASVDEINKAKSMGARVDSELSVNCPIHNVPMVERLSKRGTPYWSHKLPDGSLCFGKKPKSYT